MPDMGARIGTRHPYATWAAGICVVSGFAILTGGPRPNSIEASLPTLFVFFWGAGLLIGGVMLLAAGFLRDKLTSMLIERLGSFFLGGMCIVYSIAALTYAGLAGLFPVSLAFAFGMASWWRGWQITTRLKRYKDLLRELSQENTDE